MGRPCPDISRLTDNFNKVCYLAGGCLLLTFSNTAPLRTCARIPHVCRTHGWLLAPGAFPVQKSCCADRGRAALAAWLCPPASRQRRSRQPCARHIPPCHRLPGVPGAASARPAPPGSPGSCSPTGRSEKPNHRKAAPFV